MMRPGDYVVVERSLKRACAPGKTIEAGRVGKVVSVNGATVRVYFWRSVEVYTHIDNLRHLQHGVKGRRVLRRGKIEYPGGTQ